MRQVNLAIASLTHAHVRKYYQTLHDNNKINWVAVSCATEEVEKNFLEYGYNVPIYRSTEEMLIEHPEIDGVIIASENFRHYGDMELCCKYGKHMLSMKVPTFDLEEYDRMINMVEKSGVLCQVELEMHYNPTCTRALELARSGAVGDIIHSPEDIGKQLFLFLIASLLTVPITRAPSALHSAHVVKGVHGEPVGSRFHNKGKVDWCCL